MIKNERKKGKKGKRSIMFDLIRVTEEDIREVWEMQVAAFADLLKKYQDYDMSPAAEKIEKVLERFRQPWTTYFFIVANNEKVGAIRIVDKKDGSRKNREGFTGCKFIGKQDKIQG